MLVRRLEMQGFKSFAERVVLEFGSGVTGIVGSNGSGKSNITDAVRWVLGEQNPRLLRCSRMEDIIFNGSSTRRPVGFAEVVLVLDNSDGQLPVEWSEVSVTRRLYRSGESEYLLNGSQTRLKDILELIAGTGLGREGYSIVGQGRIDEILLAAPESRRALFDEACGIGLHRGRKREALSRLEDVAGRLERVSDVVGELEAQLEPLDRQARSAQAFVGYRDELERLELWLEGQEYRRTRSRLAAAEQRLAELTEQGRGLREREARCEAEARTLRTAHSELGEMLEQKQRETAASEAAQRQLIARIRSLEALAAEKEREAALVGEELGRQGQRRQRAASRREELERARSDRADRLTALGLELAQSGLEHDSLAQSAGELKNTLDATRSELMEVLGQAAACRYELTSTEGDAERSRAEAARLSREMDAGRAELARLRAEVAAAAERLDEITPAAERAAAELGELERREGELSSQLTGLSRELERERENVAGLEVQRASLESSLSAESLWSRSALRLAAVASDPIVPGAGGLVGVLGEELEAPVELRPALAAALGRYLDALVVRTEAELRGYMSHLRSEGLGPAVIVPLDLVARHLDRHGMAPLGPRAASLADKVSCRPELRPVVDYLLGGTAIADDLDQALSLISGGSASRAVTVDGMVVRPGGVISLAARAGAGDSPVDDTVSRMRTLREIRGRLEAARAQLGVLTGRREQAELELSEVRTRRSATASRRQSLALEQATAQQRVETARRREASLRERVDVLELEAPEAGQRALALEARARELSENRRAVAGKEESVRKEVGRLEAALRREEEKASAAARRLAELRVAVATLEEQERSGGEEAARLEEELARLDQDEATLRARLARADEERLKAVAGLGPLREQLAGGSGPASRDDDNSAGQVTEDWRKRRQEIATRLTAAEGELDRVRSALVDLGEREKREAARLARLEAEADLTARRLHRDYGEDWAERFEHAAAAPGDLSEEAVAEQVERLRGEMNRLGVVNIGAIEEHRRLSERAEFLRGQATDLEEARAGLLDLIGEMDETMAQRFEQGFLAVRRRFKDWVPELFAGGRGDLVLTDHDSILESGVEILIEPPSKKLQSLALLSAGERALAALALLLAFLDVRPSPCVILDELDAPLDDANVARFCTALDRLAARGQSQFILVTHNKVTMEVAESLYGATMAEDGVSRLVSVKLEEREQLGRQLEHDGGEGRTVGRSGAR